MALRAQGPMQRRVLVRAAAGEREAPKSLSKTSLMREKKVWLVQQLESRGLDAVGVKAELATRLLPVLALEQSAAAGLVELPANASRTALNKMRKAELVAQLEQRKLSTAGQKGELVARLLDALRRPAAEELAAPDAEELASAALSLSRRLEELDRSVAEVGARVEASEAARADERVAAVTLMGELGEMQAAWDADQAELAELEESVDVAQGEKELLPALAARKEVVLARLQKLKAGIKAKEVAAVELRDKLRLVQRAREVGVEEVTLEEDEAAAAAEEEAMEEVLAAMASLTSASAGGGGSPVPLPAAGGPLPSSAPRARRPARSVAAAGASSNGTSVGAGRVQEVSAKTAVAMPGTAGVAPPSSSASAPTPDAAPPAPASTPAAAASASTPSRGWSKLREPEAVGVVFSLVLLTVVSGLKSVLK